MLKIKKNDSNLFLFSQTKALFKLYFQLSTINIFLTFGRKLTSDEVDLINSKTRRWTLNQHRKTIAVA